MSNFTAHEAAAPFNTLNDAAVDRKNEMEQYSSESDSSDSDGNPIIEAFFEACGPSAYVKMAKFRAAEFGFLWASIGCFVLANWNVER